MSVSNKGDLTPALNTILVCTYEEEDKPPKPDDKSPAPDSTHDAPLASTMAVNQIELSLWAQPISRWPTYLYRAPLKENGTRLWMKPHHLQPHLLREFSQTCHLDRSS